MNTTIFTPLLLAAACSAAIALAPAAAADTGTLECGSSATSVCQQGGQAAAVSRTGDSTPDESADWPFRPGAAQPAWVLD